MYQRLTGARAKDACPRGQRSRTFLRPRGVEWIMSPARLPAVLALGLTLAVVAPALGDSPDPLKIARKALKTADKALALAKAPVDTDRLASGAVTSIKIANGAVGSVKITPGAVHTSKLANSAVHTSKLARGAVTRVKLRDGSVGRAKIAR